MRQVEFLQHISRGGCIFLDQFPTDAKLLSRALAATGRMVHHHHADEDRFEFNLKE